MNPHFASAQSCPPPAPVAAPAAGVPVPARTRIEDLERELDSQRQTIYQLKATVAEYLTELPDHSVQIPSLKDGDDPLIAIIRSLVDSLRQKNEQLRRENSAARSAARAKTEILANMSHEIRTPMHGIFGMVNLVLDTDLGQDQREYVETIRNSTETLLTILNDILDYSKLSSAQVTLEPRRFGTERLLRDVLRTFSANAGEKGLRLETAIRPGVPAELIGDDHRLRQVLSNLVGNAIKFTSEGSVAVEITQADPVRDDWVALHFKVSDTGPGISEGQAEHLFQPFTQAEASTSRQFGGTGLGLTISKNLVELMGGRIWVESEPGQGSVFQFTTQIQIATPGRMREATGGEACLSPFVEACELSRANGGDEEEGASQPSDPFRILLVEDNEVNQKVGQLTLEKFGFTVDVAENGIKAIELARANHYQVICMDVQMPEMDGIEATRRIRRLDSPTARASIIAMTGHAFSADRARCLDSGMDAFITKPFDLIELKTTLDRLLGLLPEEPAAATTTTTETNSDPVALSA